jgi:DNA-binding transcriptional MerR regulator
MITSAEVSEEFNLSQDTLCYYDNRNPGLPVEVVERKMKYYEEQRNKSSHKSSLLSRRKEQWNVYGRSNLLS